eukprot:8631556-Heterocapsa_arctica.AAC.1
MENFGVLTMTSVYSEINIFSSTTDDFKIRALDHVCDCRRSLLEDLLRHTYVMIGDERATLCGYSCVSKDCAGALL